MARIALTATLVLALAACAGKGAKSAKPAEAGMQAVALDHPTLVRRSGQPIIIWRDASAWMSGHRAARVQDDRGLRVTAKAWWCPAVPSDASWVGGADWGAPLAEGSRDAGVGPGLWVVVVEPKATATTLRVGDLTWSIRDAASSSASTPPLATPDRGLGDLLLPALGDPLLRWRARALIGQARPLSIPLLEALASQVEADWSSAVDRLAASDPAVAAQVRDRLLLTLQFHESMGAQHAPVWTGDPVRDFRLLDALLSGAPMARAQAANAWLSDEPSAVTWVVDDAGLYASNPTQSVWTIGVANLTQAQGIATAGSPDRPSDPRSVDARGVALLFRGEQRLPANPNAGAETEGHASAGAFTPDPAGVIEPERVAVRVGPVRQTHDVACLAAPVSPPGVRVGPLLSDWTRESWLSAQAVQIPNADWQAMALLYRDDQAMAKGGASAWHLLIECRFPAKTPGRLESLRVWLGPTPSEVAVIQVPIDAPANAEIGSGAAGEAARQAVVRVGPDRWWARVPIPADAVDATGTLRLGLERIDAKGRRTAWPRPMLPWQLEPARAAFDLRHWQGALGTSRAGDASLDSR